MKINISFFLLLIFFVSVPAFGQLEISEIVKGVNVTGFVVEGSDYWISTLGKGIYKYSTKDKKITPYLNENTKSGSDLFYCIAASPNYVWAGATDGLYVFDRLKNKWSRKRFSQGGEYGNWIRSLYFDAETNNLWIGRFIHLSRLDLDEQKYHDYDFTIKKDNKTNNFTVIKPDLENNIWFGTEAGVYKYNKKTNPDDKNNFEFITAKGRTFPNDGKYVSISTIFFDKSFTWFGTDEFISDDAPKFNVGGLYKYNKKADWERYDKFMGLPGNGVTAITQVGSKLFVAIYEFDKKSRNKLGHSLAMINRYTGKLEKMNLEQFNLPTSLITTLYFDGSLLWIGTDQGFYTLKMSNPFATFELPGKNTQKKKK